MAGVQFGILSQDALDFQNSSSASLAKITGGSSTFTLSGASGSTCLLAGLAEPTSSSDAATKNYVDSVAQGLHVKPAARLATAAAISGNWTYSAANKTLTNDSTGKMANVDGVAPAQDDIILIKDGFSGTITDNAYTASNNADMNGLWTVTTVCVDGTTKTVLTRQEHLDVTT